MQPKSRRRKFLQLAGVLVGTYLGACTYLAWHYVHPPRVAPPAVPEGLKEVEIDGPKYAIPAWTGKGGTQEVVFILAHGIKGARESWTAPAEQLLSRGYSVVIPAMSGHEASRGGQVGFGPTEADELIAVARWARGEYPFHQIVAVGISMGGAAVWLASAKDPAAFDGIVTEGAFARLGEVSDRWLDRALPLGHIWLAPVILFSRWMTGVNPSDINPVVAARTWRGRPALVIHASEDTLISRSNADDLAQAAGCSVYEVPGARHAQAYGVDPSAYIARLAAMADLVQRQPQSLGSH